MFPMMTTHMKPLQWMVRLCSGFPEKSELVEFSYVTNACGDFTALEDALVRDHQVPGTRSYRKRFKQLKELQISFEKNARNHPRSCGKLRMKVLWTTKGHLGMGSF